MKTLPARALRGGPGRRRRRAPAVLAASPCRCAGRPLAALATLQVTWIYNEFFWATVLMQTGDKFPITSSLNNLRGQFFTDYNLLSAGSVLVAHPRPGGVLRAAEAVRRRPDPRRDQGMSHDGHAADLRAGEVSLVLDARAGTGGAAAAGAALGADLGAAARRRRPGRARWSRRRRPAPSTGRVRLTAAALPGRRLVGRPGLAGHRPTAAAGRRGSWSGRSSWPTDGTLRGRRRAGDDPTPGWSW